MIGNGDIFPSSGDAGIAGKQGSARSQANVTDAATLPPVGMPEQGAADVFAKVVAATTVTSSQPPVQDTMTQGPVLPADVAGPNQQAIPDGDTEATTSEWATFAGVDISNRQITGFPTPETAASVPPITEVAIAATPTTSLPADVPAGLELPTLQNNRPPAPPSDSALQLVKNPPAATNSAVNQPVPPLLQGSQATASLAKVELKPTALSTQAGHDVSAPGIEGVARDRASDNTSASTVAPSAIGMQTAIALPGDAAPGDLAKPDQTVVGGDMSARGRDTLSIHRTEPMIDSRNDAQARTIAVQISVALPVGEAGALEIRLDPPELGRVNVSMTITDDGISASVNADRPEIMDLLRRHGELLQRELQNAGHRNVELNFAQSDASDQNSAAFSNQASELENDPDRDVTEHDDKARPQYLPLPAGRNLDIRY